MSGIRKLYTLKVNQSNRRLESQSYRDLNYKHKNNESIKNGKMMQSSTNIYSTTIGNKKRHTKNKVSSSETPKLRSHNESIFSGVKQNMSKDDVGDKENQIPNMGNYTANYDTRLLKKPPNPNSSSKPIKSSGLLKKPSSAAHGEHRKIDQSMDHASESEHSRQHDELMKKAKVQQQILTHLHSGRLPQDAIITPIVSNDGQIRQYILNDPIVNPDDIEPEIEILSADQIHNTTVDKSKCSTRRNGIVKAYAANTNKGIIRNYNEDRVSIILNILKPHSRKGEEWPK